MPVIQDFAYTAPPGKKLPTLHEWVTTLSGKEQLQFAMAEKRQLALRQQAVQENKLAVVKKTTENREGLDTYVWEDQHAQNKSIDKRKKWDRVWLQYWSRYLKETGAQFEIVEKTVP